MNKWNYAKHTNNAEYKVSIILDYKYS